MQKQHQIPIDTLVEVKYDSWYGDGACMKAHARLWVVEHSRDCDGEPLYMLADKTRETLEGAFGIDFNNHSHMLNIRALCNVFEGGLGEESLTVVEITERVKEGYGSLSWDA